MKHGFVRKSCGFLLMSQKIWGQKITFRWIQIGTMVTSQGLWIVWVVSREGEPYFPILNDPLKRRKEPIHESEGTLDGACDTEIYIDICSQHRRIMTNDRFPFFVCERLPACGILKAKKSPYESSNKNKFCLKYAGFTNERGLVVGCKKPRVWKIILYSLTNLVVRMFSQQKFQSTLSVEVPSPQASG